MRMAKILTLLRARLKEEYSANEQSAASNFLSKNLR
jgi:hypothetical protein